MAGLYFSNLYFSVPKDLYFSVPKDLPKTSPKDLCPQRPLHDSAICGCGGAV
jgi:hypothetical protein